MERTEIDSLYVKHHVIDLGVIRSSEVGYGRVDLVNSGSQSLTIESAIPDCSCTVVADTRREIPPHSELSIPISVSFRVGGVREVEKRLVISFARNRRHVGDVLFKIEALNDLRPELVALTDHVDVGRIFLSSEPDVFTVFFAGRPDLIASIPDEVEVTNLSLTEIHVPATKSPQRRLPNAVKALKVRLKPSAAWVEGPFLLSLLLKSDDPAVSELRVPISGSISRGIVASVDAVLIPWHRNERNQKPTEITFFAPRGTKLVPDLVRCSIPVVVHSEVREPGNIMSSTIAVPDGFDSGDNLSGFLTVSTNSNTSRFRLPVLIVPITGD